jgi:predicted transcriptional regulator YdeE
VDFTVVERRETLVAGTVLRSPALAVEGSRRARVEQTWQRMLARTLPGPPATAYIDFAPELNSYLTHIVGYRLWSLEQLQPGDVLARIPAGRFARFTACGDNLVETIPELWRAIWDAEAEGAITRVYAGDFERYPAQNSVEVFVGITGEPT